MARSTPAEVPPAPALAAGGTMPSSPTPEARMGPPPSGAPVHRPQLDNAIVRLLLPILPYTGKSTLNDDSARASTANLVARADERPAALSPSPSARRRAMDPSPASWVLPVSRPSTSSAYGPDHEPPPPAYEALYPPVRRARSLSFRPPAESRSSGSAHTPHPPACASSPSTAPCTVSTDERRWTRRPHARSSPRSFDSGYDSTAGGSGRAGDEDRCGGGAGGAAPVEGAAEGAAAATEQPRPGMLKRMGRTLSRERTSPSLDLSALANQH
ncbi:hypothetical protein JCM3770_005289 [Rhodotorula araucariae]